jgi:hypothetical protein
MGIFYKYLAAFLVANVVLKAGMMMTASHFPGAALHASQRLRGLFTEQQG